jgi:hypothetical protein
MGGPGSGNHWRYSGKGVCEQYNRIDIRYMRKRGMLQRGSTGSLSWSRGGEPAGSIRYKMHAYRLELNYRVQCDDGEWEPVHEEIHLNARSQPFGGKRKFFLCPSCGRNCMVLYGGKYFRCRKCHGLAYASQNGDYLDRLRTKAEKIRLRLGGEPCIDEVFPEKPKGMHWKTYDRLRSEGEALEERIEAGLAFHIARLTGLLE